MKHCNEPTTRVDQAKIIPFIPPKKEDSHRTWEEQLARALEERPEKLGFFYIPVHVRISNLPANILYQKIVEDMNWMQEKSPDRFGRCVESFDEGYKELFCTEAEIIPMSQSPKGGAI